MISSTGELLTRGTVWLALTLYVSGELARAVTAGRGSGSAARWLTTLGCATFLVHVACAFHFYHMGMAGGFVIVIFFSFWAKTFGRAHLGRIQGTAQMMTVLASAIGPLLLAQCHAWTGSYLTVFLSLAGFVGLLGLAAWCVRLPGKPGPARG